MPAERAPMRKICEALRLKHALGLSERPIAMSVGVSRSTIALAGSFHRPAHISGFPPIFCPDSPSCNSSKSRQHFASPDYPAASVATESLRSLRSHGGEPWPETQCNSNAV